ncbi:gamma-butyrobetaine dioxygenase [Crepidotus variabilis]|uniref:Gamma-butyrobetaine dioxygenase n=1 Tax=Crepidotus variabilis TaxID=179855 RepID=A0A9P6E784_9AGAR|nr:gamma-butyrobetaine dioxygenase [Crepidotus variabilis]
MFKSAAGLHLSSKAVARSFYLPSYVHGRLRQRRTWTSISRQVDSVTVHSLDNVQLPYIWLRDSCQSPESIHPPTRQKLHRTSDIPLDIAPVEGPTGVQVTQHGLSIQWKDGRTSIYKKEWLERYSSPVKLERFHMDDRLREESWTRVSISDMPALFQSYRDIKSSDESLGKGIDQLVKYGLLFIRNVPSEETSDNLCELKKVAERFSELRRTFYGLVWDVMAVKDSKNIAYTDLDLGLHMDLMYLVNPPRYQILHCLRNNVIGGISIFVDALHAAQVLRENYPYDFDLLTTTPVAFHYLNNGHHLHQERFTIQLASPKPGATHQEISHINYSPPFQAPLPISTPKEFYPALQRFAAILNDPKNTYQYTMKEGEAVLFDNRRVLHARTSFRNRTEEELKELGATVRVKDGEPSRWLKGCYIGADALLDRVRVIKTRVD